MPKARLVFDGDNIYTEKDARIYKLKSDISTKIDGIPWVVDSLDSTSATDALSANMGRTLQDQINSMSWTGKFLSTWDATTWLPGTNPQEDPYTYKVWDYYVVSTVWATNYKPHWGTYTQWVPSTTVETENVWINDKYYFDWADWVRIPDTSIQISIDTALSTTSTNAVENRAIANAINTKQDIISDLSTIRTWAGKWATALQPNDNISQLTNNVGYQTAGDVASAIAWKQDILSAWDWISISNNTVTNTKPWPAISGTAPSNPTEWMLWYDSTNDVLKVYDGSAWQEVGSDAADINTKTFFPSWINDTTTLQEIVDWRAEWNNPLIAFSYFPDTWVTGYHIFKLVEKRESNWSFSLTFNEIDYSNDAISRNIFWIEWTVSNSVYTAVEGSTETYSSDWLPTDNETVYTPTWDYNPATKKYVDDSVADIISSWSTQPANPQEWDLWYDTVNHVLKIYNWTSWETVDTDSDTTYTAWNGINIDANNEISVDTTIIPTQTDLAWKQDVLTAWDNIQISAQNVISATGTTYNAWEWIEIKNWPDYSAMQWPAPDGFHVPSTDDWVALCGILTSTFGMASNATTLGTYLKMPMAGKRSYNNTDVSLVGSYGHYWSSTPDDANYVYYLFFYSSNITQDINPRAYGFSVRCFKDTPVTPDSSWTTLYQGTWSAWVFRNSSLWLISVSWDGTTWYTIQDKNLGATIVYNQWDTETDANCGYFYQWGNNYWFPHSWTVTTSSTKVDASNYWPWNYYGSSTFITSSSSPFDRSSVQNDNLWWWVTGVVYVNNMISSTQLSNAVFSSSWDWDTTHAPSKNAIYDVLGDVETLLANL